MATIYFDTLKFADKMEASGFTREQAKAVAVAFNDAIGETLVTQTHLKETQSALESKIDSSRLETYKLILAQTAFLIGAIFVMLRFFKF